MDAITDTDYSLRFFRVPPRTRFLGRMRRKSSGTLRLERAESGVGRASRAGDDSGGPERGARGGSLKNLLICVLLLLWTLGLSVLYMHSSHASAKPLARPTAGSLATVAAHTAGGTDAASRGRQRQKKRFLEELLLVGFAAKHKDFAFLDGLYVKQRKPEAHDLESHPNLDPRRSFYKREGALLAAIPTVFLYFAVEAGAWMVGPELGSDTAYAMGEAESANPIDVGAEDGWQLGLGSEWRTVPGVRLLAPCTAHKGCPRRTASGMGSGGGDVLLSHYFCASASFLAETRMVIPDEIDTIVGTEKAGSDYVVSRHMCLECRECWNRAHANAVAHPAVDGTCPKRCDEVQREEL